MRRLRKDPRPRSRGTAGGWWWPGLGWGRSIVSVVLLTAAIALALPIGPLASASPASALMVTQPTLRIGSKGPTVVQLQRRLTTLHYDVGPIDGSFGSQTFHGVVAFQKVNGLVRDGIVGPRTWAALSRPVTLRPRRSLSSTSFEVNLTRQVGFLARQGAVLRIYDVSTGKASTPTPVGNFSIYRRVEGWRQSSLGLLWRPNYFYRGYAAHGSTSVPAYPASHGCQTGCQTGDPLAIQARNQGVNPRSRSSASRGG